MVQHEADLFTGPDGNPRRVRGVAIYTGSTRLAELAARLGFETVWIEMEHGPTGFQQAEALCQAVEAGGGVGAIRVADGQRCHVLRALETGARIVIVPMVNEVAQAEQIVLHGKFPPAGARGFNTRSRGVAYGLENPVAAFIAANERTYLFAQIETQRAVESLDAICAVPGLDGIFIGPGDLSASLGCTGDMTDERLVETVIGCIRRARSAGKHAGILVSPGPLLNAALTAGCDLVIGGGDITGLVTSWRGLLGSLPSE
jgi:2-keto-3-deoxy-L-rhamnonate aldolase RhmA